MNHQKLLIQKAQEVELFEDQGDELVYVAS